MRIRRGPAEVQLCRQSRKTRHSRSSILASNPVAKPGRPAVSLSSPVR
jgi:hypothetical protein